MSILGSRHLFLHGSDTVGVQKLPYGAVALGFQGHGTPPFDLPHNVGTICNVEPASQTALVSLWQRLWLDVHQLHRDVAAGDLLA